MHEANGQFMGQDVKATGEVSLTLASGGAQTDRARRCWWPTDTEIHSVAGKGQREIECSHTHRPARASTWYYWRVELEGTGANMPAIRGRRRPYGHGPAAPGNCRPVTT